MYVTFTTLYFAIAVLIFTFTLLKLSDRFHPYFQNSPSQFKLYYKITIIIIILIIIIGLIYKYCYLQEINMNPAKNEVYRLEQANYNIYIQDNGSADIEHLLKLHRNKNSPIKESKNFISYEFQEIGNISDIQVFVNDKKNIAQIYFENKLPYAKNPINSNGEDAVKRYDKFDDRGDYMKDFSITTRIDIKGIEKLNFKEISYLKEGAYSIDKLNILNNWQYLSNRG